MTTLNLQSHLSRLETDPLRNFKFLVNINHRGIGTSFGFTSVSGLSVQTDAIAYRTGGMNTAPQQIPGQSSFTPVTLQRGVVIGSRNNWDWMRELFDVKVGGGPPGGRNAQSDNKVDFRADVEIYVLEHPITTFQAQENAQNGPAINSNLTVKLFNAWPSSISYSDLNAGDNALFMEQMTLVHEGFALSWSGNTLPADSPGFG